MPKAAEPRVKIIVFLVMVSLSCTRRYFPQCLLENLYRRSDHAVTIVTKIPLGPIYSSDTSVRYLVVLQERLFGNVSG